jgi:hydroxymethylpyrimidine/phosphomethylpyrimidine kinase
MNESPDIPIVMAFAGNDASGGAGIQADIESLASMGCHCTPVITAITVQDTTDVKRYVAVEPGLVVEQARAVLEDMPVDSIKIGMLGSVEIIEAIHTILRDYPDIPVVYDPVLNAGGGSSLSDDYLIDAATNLLFPLTTILTPNSVEARRFCPEADNLDACAQELLSTGIEYVLITGTHENTESVTNVFYGHFRKLEDFSWDRLPHSYHGSGCTLAASIAGLLAHGMDPMAAVHEAQEYTWEALKQGYRIGMGQMIPNRLFWAREEEE